MIKPGIKIGPNDWLPKLEATKSSYCEVWHRIDKPEWYVDQFKYLGEKRINTGLHFWGAVNSTHETNVSYPGEIQEKSSVLIKKSIDVAAKNNFHYVNIHCGASRPSKINLDIMQMTPDESMDIVSEEVAIKTQKESLLELNSYAKNKGVLLLVETIPAKSSTPTKDWVDKSGRLNPLDQHSMTSKHLLNRARSDDIHITNDFCHTFSEEFDKPLDDLWKSLWNKTVDLAPYTKLLHINTLVPPYNGTDSHHGITKKDFELDGIFPTKEKLVQLLSLFGDREDVWAINEPSIDHEDNYFALSELISTL